LAWLKIKPVDPKTEDKCPNNDARHENESVKPTDTPELNTIGTKPDQNETQATTGKVHPYLKFGVNVLTLLAVIWYACEARKQRVTMDNTFNEAHQQTILLQQQVEGATAAVITKQPTVSWPDRAYISVILNNRGKTIATDIHADLRLDRISLPDEKVIGGLPGFSFAISELRPDPEDTPITRGVHLNILQNEFTRTMQQAIKITGTFTYFNGFRTKPESVCYYAFGVTEFRNKAGVVQQSMGAHAIACDELTSQLDWYRQNARDIGAH
jgi:hypothetical protein